MDVKLYPPIIDNTVTAFINKKKDPITGESYIFEVPFYLQNEDEAVSQIVLIKVQDAYGNSLLGSGDYCIDACRWRPSTTTSAVNTTRQQYIVTLPYDLVFKNSINTTTSSLATGAIFKTNQYLHVSLMVLANSITKNSLGTNQTWEGWINDKANKDLHSAWSKVSIRYPIAQPSWDVTDNYLQSWTHEIDTGEKDDNGNSIKEIRFYPANNIVLNGTLSFADSIETDKLKWYQIRIYNSADREKKIAGTDVRHYPDRDGNKATNSFTYAIDYDFDSDILTEYIFEIVYGTTKGYVGIETWTVKEDKDNSPYKEITDSGIFSNLIIDTKYLNTRGAITLAGDITPLSEGSLIFERSSSEGKWGRFLVAKVDASETNFEYQDLTLEPGIPYKYRVTFTYDDTDGNTYYKQNSFNDDKYIISMPEDIILTTRDTALRVRYNPTISNFKRNIVDTITPTLGGAYPFIYRNQNQKYKTFSLGGLISCALDSWITDDTLHPRSDASSVWFNTSSAIDTATYKELLNGDIYGREVVYERLFRDKVMDFLYDDHIILFKSLQEGNMFIKLTNVQFTPEKQLGRNIYSFTATATEVCAANEDNYVKYFSPEEPDEVITFSWLRLNATAVTTVANDSGLDDVIAAVDDTVLDTTTTTLTLEQVSRTE